MSLDTMEKAARIAIVTCLREQVDHTLGDGTIV